MNSLINIIQTVCRIEDWILGEAWIPNEKWDYLEFAGEWHDKTNDEKLKSFISSSKEKKFFKGVGLVGKVWQSQKPEWIYDIENCSSNNRFVRIDEANRVGIRTAMGFPIVSDNAVTAVVILFHNEQKPIDRDLIASLSASFGREGVATSSSEQIERLKQVKHLMINHDLEIAGLRREIKKLKKEIN